MKKFLIISFLTYALVSCKTPINQSSETNHDSLGAINSKLIDTSKLVNKQFSLTYTIGDSLYLFEKHQLNTTVSIIDNENAKILEAKTTGYIAYFDDILGDIVLTRIFPQPI